MRKASVKRELKPVPYCYGKPLTVYDSLSSALLLRINFALDSGDTIINNSKFLNLKCEGFWWFKE